MKKKLKWKNRQEPAKNKYAYFNIHSLAAALIFSILLIAIISQSAYAAAGGNGQGRGTGGKPLKSLDTVPPMITAPPDVVAEATGTLTTVSLGQPVASDNKDPSPTVTNNAPSKGFPLGITIVTWKATDSSGNTATADQKVTIQDTTSPSLVVTQPAGYANFERGKSITLAGTASDYFGVKSVEAKLGATAYVMATDTQSWVVMVPVPEDYALGGDTVTVRSFDNNGNVAYASKSVNITDTTSSTTTSTSTTTSSSSTIVGSYLTSYTPAFLATGSNYYDIPDNSALRLQTFSLAAWFNTTMPAPALSAIIAGKGGFGSEVAGQNMNYGIWIDRNNSLVAGFEASDGSNLFVQSKQQYNDGKWHYSVVTYDGKILRLSVDGQTVAWRPTTVPPDTAGTQPLRIASNAFQNDRYFKGQIDEARVWNKALTTDEISSQYANGTFSLDGQLAYMNGTAYTTYYSNSGGGTTTGTNNAPVANAGTDSTVLKNSVAYLDGSASYDPDGSPITFSWKQTSGPAVTLSNSAASNPSFVSPNVAYGITAFLSFSLTVSDGTASSSDAVNVTDIAQDIQAPTGSIKINSGALYTSVTSVTLTLSCSDSESGCAQMMISVDGTFDTEVFGTFATSKTVTLPSGDGLKTVKVVFKDAAGNVSPIYSASITLDTNTPGAPVITIPVTGTTTTNTKPTISGTAEASSTVTVYYVTDTSTVSIGTAKTSSAGSWSVTPSSGMAAATYNIQAKASDAAGNVSPASAIVKLTIYTTTTIIVPSTSYTYTFCSSGCTYSNLQTAINALPSGGGSILIKDGQYTWSNSIWLKSGTSLVFSSGAYITFTGSSKTVLGGNGVSNVSINGGSITAEYFGVKAIAFWKSSGINVNGTKMHLQMGSNSNAFYCEDCIDVYVSNIDAHTASRLVDIKTSTRDASSGLTRNVWIQNSVFDGASIEGVKVNYSTKVYIIGNKISNTADNGIDVGFNIDSTVKGNTIINTGMPNGAAVHTDSTNTALVQDNYIDGTGETAIAVHKATKVDVIGNVVKNSGKEGIHIVDSTIICSYVNIKYNHIISPAMEGIYESPNQKYVEIAYNTLEQIPSGYQPIRVVLPNPTTSVHDNTIIS